VSSLFEAIPAMVTCAGGVLGSKPTQVITSRQSFPFSIFLEKGANQVLMTCIGFPFFGWTLVIGHFFIDGILFVRRILSLLIIFARLLSASCTVA